MTLASRSLAPAVCAAFLIATAGVASEASIDRTTTNLSLIALAISPAAPAWNSSLDVTMAVDRPELVERVQFFMCIIDPKTICFPPAEMAESGNEYSHSTEALETYPLAQPRMNVGVRFSVKTVDGNVLIPSGPEDSRFGFEVTNNSHNNGTLYFVVPVIGEPAVPVDAWSPATKLLAPIAAGAVACGVPLLLLILRRRRLRDQTQDLQPPSLSPGDAA
jgi:hypothetical protein